MLWECSHKYHVRPEPEEAAAADPEAVEAVLEAAALTAEVILMADQEGNSMVAFLAQGVIIAAACSGSIVFARKVRKAGKESKQQIKAYEKSDENWNYRKMQNYVEEGYYRIQECWRRQDPDYAKDYLSQSLLENWKVKLSWMAMRDEEEIQENVRLLSAKPVHVKNPEGIQEDVDIDNLYK